MKQNVIITLDRFGRVVAISAATAGTALAQTSAQPDTSAAIAYIGAGVATVLGVFGAKYLVRGAILLGRWVQGVIGR
jgi:hypothetical protein